MKEELVMEVEGLWNEGHDWSKGLLPPWIQDQQAGLTKSFQIDIYTGLYIPF